jgi:hypothetical protein
MMSCSPGDGSLYKNDRLEVGCHNAEHQTCQPTHLLAADRAPAAFTCYTAYWDPPLAFSAVINASPAPCTGARPVSGRWVRAGARMRATSWLQAAGLPCMRPAHVARAAKRPPRPSGRRAPSSHPKRLGAAHLRGGAGVAPQVPADAPRGSPVRLAATRQSNIGAHPFWKAAQRLGGHHTASGPPFQLAGPVHDACAPQRRWRRGAFTLHGGTARCNGCGGRLHPVRPSHAARQKARTLARPTIHAACWVAPAAGRLRARWGRHAPRLPVAVRLRSRPQGSQPARQASSNTTCPAAKRRAHRLR